MAPVGGADPAWGYKLALTACGRGGGRLYPSSFEHVTGALREMTVVHAFCCPHRRHSFESDPARFARAAI